MSSASEHKSFYRKDTVFGFVKIVSFCFTKLFPEKGLIIWPPSPAGRLAALIVLLDDFAYLRNFLIFSDYLLCLFLNFTGDQIIESVNHLFLISKVRMEGVKMCRWKKDFIIMFYGEPKLTRLFL